MTNNHSKNQEELERLEKAIENGSPFQGSAVEQMGRIIRGEAAVRDYEGGVSKEKEGDRQPHVRTGEFFIQTQGGKFLYAYLEEEANVIVLPIGTMPLAELSQIAEECLADYRPAEPEDFNFVYDRKTPPMKEIQPTPELLTLGGKLTLISREPILSDTIYQGKEKPNWGRVEINISDVSSTTHGMDVVMPSGEYISYFIPWDSLSIATFPYDLSGRGSPDKENEFRSNKGKYGNRAYSVVKNKEEYGRLFPSFWQIIKRLISEDKVAAISSKPVGIMPLTLGEAKRHYNVRPVASQKRLKFEGVKPNPWDYEGEGFPVYFFPMGDDEIGVLVDRADSRYIKPYIFSTTRWYKEGISIDELEMTTE